MALPWHRKPQSAAIVARKDILLATADRNGMKPPNLAVIQVETTTSKRKRSLPRSRQDPRIQLLNRSGVLYTRLPHATTPNVTRREHHARRNDNAHIAWFAAVLLASAPPVYDDEKPSFNFDDDLDKGFAFSRPAIGSDERGFHPNVDRITMIVDSGASDHLADDELIPRLRDNVKDYKKLKEQKIIVTPGNKEVFATATGTIWGCIID